MSKQIERDNDATFTIVINELQRGIIAAALYEFVLKLKMQPDTSCIRDEAYKLDELFSELDQPLKTRGKNSFVT